VKAAAVAESVRQAASAQQALLPAAEVAAVSGAKVQPPGAAVAESALSVRQPGAAEVPSGAEVGLLPEAAAVVVSGAEAGLLPEAAAVVPGAAAEPQQAVAAVVLLGAEVLRPGAAAEPAPSARRLAAGHPSGVPSWRLEGPPLPWLAPRQAVRSARGMRRSRTASPSRRSWRAARCEGLS
jgi:hypothetical protein